MAWPTDRMSQHGPQSGFTLLWMSVILTVVALGLSAILPGGEAGDYNHKAMTNIQKLDKVEDAMKGYMALKGHRPCPADGQYDTSSQYFGVEAANPGTCISGTPTVPLVGGNITTTGDITAGSNLIINMGSTAGLTAGLAAFITSIPPYFSATIVSVDSASQVTLSKVAPATASSMTFVFSNYIVGGVIPTKTLNLPDDYALDEFGHRFTYVVDTRATQKNSCEQLMGDVNAISGARKGKGGVTIKNTSGAGGMVIDNTMYAYISHGKSGEGAWPASGAATPAGRINTGNTDPDKLVNAAVDVSFTYNPTNFINVKVRKDPTVTFDDSVYYADYLKNACCVGSTCKPLGFRMDDYDSIAGFGSTQMVDINGDGIPDLVTSDAYNIYVIFGKKNGLPGAIDGPPWAPGTVLNGTNGFQFTAPNMGTFAAGDINGDGIQDLVMVDLRGKVYILWGNRTPGTWPAYSNFGAHGYTDMTVTGQITTFDIGFNTQPWPVNLLDFISLNVGDVSGHNDGTEDIIVGMQTKYNFSGPSFPPGSYSQVNVIFGHKGAWTWPAQLDPSYWNGTNGLMFTSNSDQEFGWTLGIGDVNGDGIKDVVVGGWDSASVGTYVIFGRKKWPISPATVESLMNGADGYSITGNTNGGTYGAVSTFRPVSALADLNGDGIKDILSGDALLFGQRCGLGQTPCANVNLTTTNLDGTNGFIITPSNSYSSNFYDGFGNFVAGDVNGDGIDDLMVSLTPYCCGPRPGGVGVLFGHTGPWSSIVDLSPTYMNGINGVLIEGDSVNNTQLGREGTYAARNLAIGDFNGDGFADMIVDTPIGGTPLSGPPGVSLGNANGSIYVIYGRNKVEFSYWNTPQDLTGIGYSSQW